MIRKDRIIVGVVLAQIAGLAGITFWHWRYPSAPQLPAPVPQGARAELLIDLSRGFLGKSDSPVTLIEFGDYECPPCARSSTKIMALMAKYPGKIRFQFRQFPNVRKHPYSLAAAVSAEETRLAGNSEQFWAVHENLYRHNGNIDNAIIATAARSAGTRKTKVTRQAATKVVESDIRTATGMKVSYTPAFFVCLKNGVVYQLNDLSQAKDFL